MDNTPEFAALWSFVDRNPAYINIVRLCLIRVTEPNQETLARQLQRCRIKESMKRQYPHFCTLIGDLLKSAKDDKDHWNEIRGRLGERIALRYLALRFGQSHVVDNPRIYIDEKLISFKGRKTVDAAAWISSSGKGAFWEVKISPKWFDEQIVRNYLNHLSMRLRQVKVSVPVAAVTLHTQEVFGPNGPFSYVQADYIGVEWLAWEDIRDYGSIA